MSLRSLIPLLNADPALATLNARLGRLPTGQAVEVDGLASAARAAALAGLLQAHDGAALVLTGRLDAAEDLISALNEYLPAERQALLWPVPEELPYEHLPVDRATSARRVEILARLQDGLPQVVVAPARGLTELLGAPPEVAAQRVSIRVGDRLRQDALVARLLDQGYEAVSLVTEPGQVSRRGGIVDIFPPTTDQAVRIELFGDEVDSLRLFDPETQRSTARLDHVELLPAFELPLLGRARAAAELARLDTRTLRPEVSAEWSRTLRLLEHGDVRTSLDLLAPYLLDEPACLLDYLPEHHLLVAVEPVSILLSTEQVAAQAEELREALESAGELPTGLRRPYFRWDEIAPRLARTRQVIFGELPAHWAPRPVAPVDLQFAHTGELPLVGGRVEALLDELEERLTSDWRVVIATEQAPRLTELMEERGIYPRASAERPGRVPPPPAPGTIDVVRSRLAGGWLHAGIKLLVLTDREIFGYRHVNRAPSRRKTAARGVIGQLGVGQYVVHIEHGIARYGGIVRLEISGVEREYLQLDYAENDRLYLPVDQIDRITIYEGGGAEARLTRLGSPEWARVKQRVRAAVREMAFELLQLYAAREASQSPPFPPDGVWDRELEESFPYTETPDQLRAIEEVKLDLMQTRPMDRLVCGDVGYGKTEVALRAAFKAVNVGYQVAILVPTTVLALQHLRSFRERLGAFPVKVEMLSRLRTRGEQSRVLEGLKNGEVDIVIGTHRLLQKDVSLQRLGLLIIDEEQRFGVQHKEILKQARTDVHVLTMTATPIPRTLHMALSGIRDLSVINTPPRDRTPIRTFVTPNSELLIREAILRELSRGGQVYFVHNRVQTIYHVLRQLQSLVPEARFGVGHGQMDEGELEQVMLRFVEHEFDVLICTTIIESGVDIPNVNTVIIDRAGTFGLTQLYQLRGRVGRGNHRAYAYLLYDATKPLSDEALQRLEVIQEATELGAGFQIALRDLEIRGAGNILGAEQSGHIAAVGFDLYTRMLALAVEEVRQGRPIEEPEAVSLDLPLEAIIPESYAADETIRIDIYRKLAAIRSYGELRDIQAELIDRFGPLPDPVIRLVDLARLRVRLSALGITSIVEREGEVYVRPVVGSKLDQLALRRALGDGVTVTPNQVRLTLARLHVDAWAATLAVVEAVEEAEATVLAGAL